MVTWMTDYSIWVLIGSALLVIILLFFGEKMRKAFAARAEEKNREKTDKRIGITFWVLEAVFAVIMLGSLVPLLFTKDGGEPLVTSEDARLWVLEHGVAVIITLVVAIALWAVLKTFVPAMIKRFMAHPMLGESSEGTKKRANTLVGVFLGVSRLIIIIVAVLMVLSEIGLSVGPILAGFGVVGIAVGFGAQYMIRDLIAGVFILMENQYRIGDIVKIAEVSGTVEDINLRKTVLRDADGAVHHVPNGEIRVSSNFTRHFARINLNVTVSYTADLGFAINVINRVCREMAEDEKWKKALRTTPEVLRVDNLGQFGVDIKIIGDVRPPEQWNVMGELRLRIKNAFDKESIDIPYPPYDYKSRKKPGEEKPGK